METRVSADESEHKKIVVHSFPSHYSVRDVLQEIGATDSEDAFYIVNLERLVFQYNQVSNVYRRVGAHRIDTINSPIILLYVLCIWFVGYNGLLLVT